MDTLSVSPPNTAMWLVVGVAAALLLCCTACCCAIVRYARSQPLGFRSKVSTVTGMRFEVIGERGFGHAAGGTLYRSVPQSHGFE